MDICARLRIIQLFRKISIGQCSTSSRTLCSSFLNRASGAAFVRYADGSSRRRYRRQSSTSAGVKAWAKQQQHVKLSSSLYTPPEEGEHVPFVLKPDLNFDLMFRAKDLYEESVAARRLVGIDMPKMVSLWQEVCQLENEKSELEKQRTSLNSKAKEISKQKGDKTKDTKKEEIKQEGRRIREDLKKINSSLNDLMATLYPMALALPNVLHMDVRGITNRVLETVGDPEPRSSSAVREHELLSTEHPLVHPGYCYTQGDLVLKEMDLVSSTSSLLGSLGYTQLSMPDMFKPIALEALGMNPEDSKETYAIETSENLMYLAGTSPMGFLAYYMMTVLEAGDLPQRSFAVGRHYNASAETSSFQGLHRQFQDTTIEVFGVSQGSEAASYALFSQYLQTFKGHIASFGVPFRLVDVASTGLLPCTHRKVAIEVWMPEDEAYVEVANVCNCTDFISRRLKIRYPSNPRESAKQSRQRSYAHTIHGTALRSSVLLSSMLQHGAAISATGHS